MRGRGVPPDRRLRVRGALVERPTCSPLRTVPVAHQDAGLENCDRPSPASRRRELVALPVTLDGPGKPLSRCRRIATHEACQPRPGGGVAHPGQLALAGVLILGVRQSDSPSRYRASSRRACSAQSTTARAYENVLLRPPAADRARTGVHSAHVDGEARRRGAGADRRSPDAVADVGTGIGAWRSRSQSTGRMSRCGRPTRARRRSSSRGRTQSCTASRTGCTWSREICSTRSPSPSTSSSRTCPIFRRREPDPRYDNEPPEAVYAPGDGLDPYRRLLNACRDGKLETGGTLLIQFHREPLAANCWELEDLREQLEASA